MSLFSNQECRAFLDAISAEPDDDTNRLVFADWLEERGEVVRAGAKEVKTTVYCRFGQATVPRVRR